jgi:glycolate oxidase FAD binding subunit
MAGTGESGAVLMADLVEVAAAVCADVREGGAGDVFAGHRATAVATPATAAEVAALLAATAPLGAAVAVRGGGTQADLGAPARALDLLIDLRRQEKILEYDPGDLVVRAQAGTTLAALRARLLEHQQFLALDGPATTLGGLVATGVSGPRRHRYGSVRDLLIGAGFVLADGTRAKAGGKVVKNVAGYDLCKLLAGSLGTLAVITEVTFRLHPRPPAQAVVTVPLSTPGGVGAAVSRLHASRLEPVAVELGANLRDGTATLVLLFEGLEEVVRRQAADAADLLAASTPDTGGSGGSAGEAGDAGDAGQAGDAGDAGDAGEAATALPAWWGRHPWVDLAEPVLGLRVACAPAAVGPAVTALATFAGEAAAVVRGRAAVGVLEAAVAAPDGIDAGALAALRSALDPLDGTAVVTHWVGAGPPGGLDRWGPVRGLQLMRAVKNRFDPDHRLAPGRFAGGI